MPSSSGLNPSCIPAHVLHMSLFFYSRINIGGKISNSLLQLTYMRLAQTQGRRATARLSLRLV
jgi:hypothetical protein